MVSTFLLVISSCLNQLLSPFYDFGGYGYGFFVIIMGNRLSVKKGSPIKGLVKRKNTSPLKNIDIFFD
jgi:O-antigen/teichoic acid export membrane protein